MKTIKNMLVFVALLITTQLNAQTNKETTLKIINAQHYIFNASSAMPMANADVSNILSKMPGGNGAGMIQLTGAQYQLTVTKDSIEAYLPYYGRAYTATMNPDDSGIKFKSKDFKYKAEKKKKGTWIITISPKDTKDTQSLILNISENGYATLNVNNNNRQPISFYGYLSEPKEKKK